MLTLSIPKANERTGNGQSAAIQMRPFRGFSWDIVIRMLPIALSYLALTREWGIQDSRGQHSAFSKGMYYLIVKLRVDGSIQKLAISG
jgi:hypothetical protein